MLRFFTFLPFILTFFASVSAAEIGEERGDGQHPKKELAEPSELVGQADNIPSPSLSVLVAEDNAVIRVTMLRYLSTLGHKVMMVRNGQEAVTAVKDTIEGSACFDVVLTDIEMPIMDGITAAMEIRKLPDMESLPIIAVTASEDGKIRERCLAGGINDILIKPLSKTSLEMLLENYKKRIIHLN